MINFAKSQAVANRYLSALDYAVLVLSYFHVEGCGVHYSVSVYHLASIFNVGLILKIIYAAAEKVTHQPKLLDSIKRTDSEGIP